jgi:NAD(P)-dependent dehydrogenase (short-subunit alcohol dehydrogenase family)
MQRQLENKVAFITGTTTGIGRAIVKRFLAEGARVVGLSRSAVQPDDVAEGYISLAGDVRSASDNQRAVATAVEHFGGLDIFVGNAGIYDNRFPFAEFTPSTLESTFDDIFGVNVKGYMLGAQASYAELSKRQGCIIFTNSISGTHAGFGGTLYVAAKHAVTGLTKQLALELAPSVRVNAVASGYVPTNLRGSESLPEGAQKPPPRIAADMPLEVLGTPDDHAAAFVFLASDACSRTATGTILTLDGGSTLRGPGSPIRK